MHPNRALDFVADRVYLTTMDFLMRLFHIFLRLRPLHSLILFEKESVCLSKCFFRLLFTVIWCFLVLTHMKLIPFIQNNNEYIGCVSKYWSSPAKWVLDNWNSNHSSQIRFLFCPLRTTYGNQIHFKIIFFAVFTLKYIMGKD